MKKSKFLQNPKDLLSRSFNPSKCKTSLRLAGSRLKLLRNKKEVQIKQMKREIAQLLESGEDRTARIRVEHVVREEKMMAAYDLIEIYCELIVARLPIIESQKHCPIDLKEAIASVIFASPRCGDVPELLDVKKHFTAKYGKDFLIAAIELRPASGVSSMLIEKLSAKAPDLQTKIKILSAIAEEHNIKWDANSLDEKDLVPPNDLLSGPSTFGRENDVHVEPSRVESPVFQPSPSNNKISLPLNVPQLDPITSIGPEKLVHPHDEVFQPKASPTGLSDERSQLFKGNSNTVPPDRQSWHMGFKDATSAAQAAAESAERASMAARAAAELSNRDRLMRQHSTESYNAEDVYVSKDEGPEFYANSKPTSEQFSEVRVEKLSENTRLRNEQIDKTKTNDLKTASNFRNNNRGGRKEHRHSNSEAAGGYSWKDSLTKDSRSEMLMKKESFKNEVESADDIPEKSENIIEEFKNEVESEDNIPEKSENIIEERIVKQPSVKSSRSHSSVSDDVNIFANSKIHMDGQSFEKSESTIEERIGKQPNVNSSHSHSNVSDDVNIFSKAQEFEYDAGQDPFVSIHKGDTHGEASHESAFAYFDKCDFESDSHGFDIGPRYDEHESQYHSTEHLSFNTDSWGPRSSKPVKDTSSLFFTRKNSFPEFSENMTSVSSVEVDNSMPLTFDDSDGSTSENNDDNNMSKHIGITESKNSPRTHEKIGSPKESRYTEFEREHLSFSDNKFQFEKNEAKKSNADFQEFGETSHLPEESSFDSGEGLNFQQLTGGFRHKGYNRPPYFKNQSDESSLLKDTTSTIKSLDKRTSPQRKRGTRKLAVDLDSDSDSSEEDMSSQKKPGHKQEPYALSSRKDVNPKLSLRTSNSIFGSGNSDSDGDAPKESPSRKNNHRSGISRRTKLSPISSAHSSYSKTRIDAETLDSDAAMDTKPRTSQISEIPKESESKIRILSQQESYEQPTSLKPSSKPAKSNYWGPPEQFENSKPTNSIFLGTSERVKSEKAQKSKISRKSSVVEESTRSESKMEKSTIHESPKAGKYSENSSSKDEGSKKASHVHPKLPDYDSLVQSLRMNRS